MSWKKPVLMGAWSLATLAWLVQIPVLLMMSDKTAKLLSLSGAVLLTEIAFYATAGLLGLTLLQSRQKVWATVKTLIKPKSANKDLLHR
ncbi:MAG: hypothetical protein AAF296_09110 [Pseudomonadota bacterium]